MQAKPAEPVVVTHLEMRAPLPRAPITPPAGAMVMRAVQPTVAFYRFLYDTVGGLWHWTDRRRLTDEALAAILLDPAVSVYVAYVDGTPAGYIELDAREHPDVEIKYFGLMPEFLGRGLGPYLLDFGIREAWARGARRVHVNTCTLDHPAALGLYRRMGFEPFRTEIRPEASGGALP